MKIKVLVVGKTPTGYVREGCELYLNRLKHYTRLEWVEIPDRSSHPNGELARIRQSELILEKLKPEDVLVLLDERGTEMTSREWSAFLDRQGVSGTKTLCMAIGGAYGFSEAIYARCKYKMSLSRLTFPHDLVRIILLEQLYRAFTISKGESYHHD